MWLSRPTPRFAAVPGAEKDFGDGETEGDAVELGVAGAEESLGDGVDDAVAVEVNDADWVVLEVRVLDLVTVREGVIGDCVRDTDRVRDAPKEVVGEGEGAADGEGCFELDLEGVGARDVLLDGAADLDTVLEEVGVRVWEAELVADSEMEEVGVGVMDTDGVELSEVVEVGDGDQEMGTSDR